MNCLLKLFVLSAAAARAAVIQVLPAAALSSLGNSLGVDACGSIPAVFNMLLVVAVWQIAPFLHVREESWSIGNKVSQLLLSVFTVSTPECPQTAAARPAAAAAVTAAGPSQSQPSDDAGPQGEYTVEGFKRRCEFPAAAANSSSVFLLHFRCRGPLWQCVDPKTLDRNLAVLCDVWRSSDCPYIRLAAMQPS